MEVVLGGKVLLPNEDTSDLSALFKGSCLLMVYAFDNWLAGSSLAEECFTVASQLEFKGSKYLFSAEDCPKAAVALDIKVVPSLIVVEDGVIKGYMGGIATIEQYQAFIDTGVDPCSDLLGRSLRKPQRIVK